MTTLILNFGTGWREIHFTLRALYLAGKNHGTSLDRRLGGFENRSGHFGEKGNLLLLYQCKIFVL
jgi:hypothetical protein